MSQLQQQQDEVDQGAMAQLEISENEKIKQKVRKCYAKIASSLNPMGTVVDKMIASEVITFEQANDIHQKKTNSERTFELIGEVILAELGHPEGFIVFREALGDEYPWMVKMIDETVVSGEKNKSEENAEEKLKLEQHNEDLKTAIKNKCLPLIRGSVDPKGHIMDLLYQENILTWDHMKTLMELQNKDLRIRKLTDILNQSTNSKTYIIFRESLDKDYKWVVRKINDAMKPDFK